MRVGLSVMRSRLGSRHSGMATPSSSRNWPTKWHLSARCVICTAPELRKCLSVSSRRCGDFVTALELGYPTESVEINNWFYRSLVVNEHSLAHFLSALPDAVWPHGPPLPRTQARWGFAVFRGQEDRARAILEYLYGLCFEAGEPPTDEIDQQKLELHKNLYSLMEAISKKDSASATTSLHKRMELRPIVPPEGTRYESFQPLDLIGLGLCRLARLRGMTVKIDHSSLPLALLDLTY